MHSTNCTVATATTHPQLLLLGQQVVVLVALIQGHQHVLQPVPHAQGELLQLRVQAGLDDCRAGERKWNAVRAEPNLTTHNSLSITTHTQRKHDILT